MPKSFSKAKKTLINSTQSLKKDKEIEYKLDEFDTTIPITEQDVCALCKLGQTVGVALADKFNLKYSPVFDEDEENENAYENYLLAKYSEHPKIQDTNGVWVANYSLATGIRRRAFVHFACALFSPQCWFTGERWNNVGKEITRSASLICKICRLKGATLGCCEKKCQNVYHIPCVVDEGFINGNVSLFKVASFYCPDHQKVSESKEVKHEVDFSNGRENMPIRIKNFQNLEIPENFEYILVNCDSDDVMGSGDNVSNVPCCNCDGLCSDPEVCACLRGQRNYSVMGHLIPSLNQPILECNMRCNCSLRRCTNRVVDNGVVCQLELFSGPVPVSSSHAQQSVASPSEQVEKKMRSSDDVPYWGVRTAARINAGAFVCEMKGQYLLGGSMLPAYRRVYDNGSSSQKGQKGNDHQSNDFENRYTVGRDIVLKLRNARTLDVMPLCWWDIPDITVDSVYQYVTTHSGKGTVDADVDTPTISQSSVNDNTKLDTIENYLKDKICMDSRYFGNVSSYIRRVENISGQRAGKVRNLNRVRVYNNHDSSKFPKLALFASCDIFAGQELVY